MKNLTGYGFHKNFLCYRQTSIKCLRHNSGSGNMDMILVFLVFLLDGLLEVDGMSVRGVVGDQIEIKCPHTNAYSNIKYFCKGACSNDHDILVTSQERKHSNAKYSINNEGNTFYVTISDLKLEDSGTCWCGVERVGLDTYTHVILEVIDGSSHDIGNTSYSKRLVYTGAGLGVAAMALGMALLIFFRHRKRNSRILSVKEHDTIYETPSIHKENGPGANILSSASDDQQTETIFLSSAQLQDTSGDHLEVVYSNVSSAAHVQENNPLYSTICFSNLTDCSTVSPQTATTTYSSLKLASTVC